MRTSFCACAVLALIGLSADLALGHGGVFTGPAGRGTPTFGGPAGGGTGGNNGGPTGAGGIGGGNTGGGLGSGGGATPGTGGGPPRPGAKGGHSGTRMGGATPGKPKGKDDQRLNDWDFWWELNDDQFLQIKAAVRANENATSDEDRMLGSGEARSIVTGTQIRSQILPALRIGMKTDYFDTKAGAVIAAGKVVDQTFAEMGDVLKEMYGMLTDGDKIVRESACLGMGLLGSKEALPTLLAVMRNDAAARAKATGSSRDISVRERAFAALAIGLIGAQEGVDGSVVTALVDQIKKNEAHPDLQVFPALALGIMRSDAAVKPLKDLAFDPDMPEIVRAHTIIALAKLHDRSSVGQLKEALTDRSTQVQRSAAIALGLLTDRADEKTVDVLITHAKSDADRAVRNFSMIALGQIGHARGRDFLFGALRRGQQHDKTFAALALGVYGNKFMDARNELGNELLAAWKDSKSDSDRGAFAIGMGLIDYKAGAPALIEELKTGGSPDLKGHVATALGLMGEKNAIPLIQELAKKVSDQDTQRRASIALGLIGDRDAVKVLAGVIEESAGNLSALGGAAVALGFIGDRYAVPILGDLLTNASGTVKDNARAFAAVALGILGDKGKVPLLSKVQEDCNYLATTEGLSEILLIY